MKNKTLFTRNKKKTHTVLNKIVLNLCLFCLRVFRDFENTNGFNRIIQKCY